MFTWISSLFRTWFGKEKLDRELDAEVRSYVEMATEEKIASGMNKQEARRAALVEAGGLEQIKERTREVRMGTLMETVWQDIRYAARMLRKNPGFTAVAVLTLALGIGSTTAMYSVANSVLIRPLDYPQPEKLVRAYETSQRPYLLRYYEEWQGKLDSFEEFSWIHQSRGNLSIMGVSLDARIVRAPASFFHVFRMRPLAGRLILPEDEEEGQERVVLLGEDYWRRLFAADPAAVGQTIRINRRLYTVAGVVSVGSYFRNIAVWLPWRPGDISDEGITAGVFRFYGRLKEGTEFSQGRLELETLFMQLKDHARKKSDRAKIFVKSLEEQAIGGTRRSIYLFLGVAGLVWLLVCVNLANLLLSRTLDRQRELAVRSALGAGRGRLVRQVLTETSLLSILGGAAGLLLAHQSLNGLVVLLGRAVPSVVEVEIDTTVLIFTLVFSLLTGWLFGLAPILGIFRLDVNRVLQFTAAGPARGRARLRSTLVVAQVALAFTLLIGAGLLIHSHFLQIAVDTGVAMENGFWIEPTLPREVYPDAKSRSAYLEAASRQLGRLPGVDSAGFSVFSPLTGASLRLKFHAEDFPERKLRWGQTFVSSGYHRALGIPLMAGRPFSQQDRNNKAGVVILSSLAAREYGSPQAALGRKLRFGGGEIPLEVVGVAADIRGGGPAQDYSALMYVPHWIMEDTMPLFFLYRAPTFLHVRIKEEPRASLTDLRRSLRLVDADVPVTIRSFRLAVDQFYARIRRMAVLFGLLAGLAILVASLGLYGSIAYSVSQRTHEIGVRMALGAQRSDILKSVVGQGMTLVGIGLAVGLLASYWLTRFLKSFLFEVEPTDPATFVVVSLVLSVVALFACYLPARRATRVDPMTALRYE